MTLSSFGKEAQHHETNKQAKIVEKLKKLLQIIFGRGPSISFSSYPS
jgi:hypothetical protein